MSAPYRARLQLSLPDAHQIIDGQQNFPIPARQADQTDSEYHAQIRNSLKRLEDANFDASEILAELSDANDKWMNLRTNMTGAERALDNPLYDEFVITYPYPQAISDLRRYIRTLRTQKRALEDALPPRGPPVNIAPLPPPPAPSFAHLPKTNLPTFSGDFSDYLSFWNQFKAGVHDLPNMSDSIKLTYLKQCLSGSPLTLINSLPVSDESYAAALDLLESHYGNPEDVARALHNSLRKLPHLRKGEHFCPDLRSLVDQMESICVQMAQQGTDYNTTSFQMEIEEKLPRFVLDEIFLAKEEDDDWTTDKLKNKLRNILKRKEQIESLSPKPIAHHKSKSSPSPTPYNYHSPSSPSNEPSLTFYTHKDGTKPPLPNSRAPPKISPKLPCLFCEQPGHFSSRCSQFPDHQSRISRLTQLKRCFKCMKDGHMSKQCPNPARCTHCSGPHPRALCKSANDRTPPSSSTNYSQHHTANPTPPFPPPSTSAMSFNAPTPLPTFHPQFYPNMHPAPAVSTPMTPIPKLGSAAKNPEQGSNPPTTQTNSSIVCPTRTQNPAPILLKFVRATFFNPENRSQQRQGLVLLDDASTHSFISTNEARALNLSLSPSSMRLGVFNNPQCKNVTSFSTRFGLKLLNGNSLIVHATTVDHLTQPTPFVAFTPELLSYTEFQQFESECPVILLGSDYYYEVEPLPLQRLPTGYHLIHTLLGPIVAGKSFSPVSPSPLQISNYCFSEPNPFPPPEFFTLESVGVNEPPPPSSTDDLILQKFNSEIEFINGRYQVKFPWKEDPSVVPLPSNFGLCWGRLRSTLLSLSKDPTLLSQYNTIIKEQIALCIIEPVKDQWPISPPLHYLPHHPVINHEKAKVRIVYDGSAHLPKELSLNDCLHPGPVLIPELIGLLLRFRFPKIAIISDIEKAFLQVSVHPSQRDCTRFLWIKDIDSPLSVKNLQIFRFTRVAFGLAPSPFLLAATIKHHLSQNPSPLSSEIGENMYVDNLFISADNPLMGQEKCSDLISLFEKAGMNVREFVSNSSGSLSQLPDEKRLTGSNQKFLGVNWQTDADTLKFTVSPPSPSFTPSKRSILTFVASFYDPLGLITPVLLPIKIFLQTLWDAKIQWDDLFTPELHSKWSFLLSKWTTDSFTSVPRYPSPLPSLNRTYELHGFSDASITAMCCAVYVRVSHPSSPSSSSFLLFSKTKVKPVNNPRLTIPRLELIAALMGARALHFVSSHLQNFSLDSSLNLWSDSSAVLSWLNSPSPIKDIFVFNRIKSIHSIPNLIVRHLPGTENPADIGSRGLPSIDALSSSALWWTGPPWLSLPSEQWPFPNSNIKSFNSNEVKDPPFPSSNPSVLFSFHTIQQPPTVPNFDLNRFSRLPKLLRIVAYFRKFLMATNPNHFPKQFNGFKTFIISPPELRLALSLLIKQEQNVFPPKDRDNESLGLFVDDQQILRAKGRLSNSQLNPNTIHPIYLPPESGLTRLIIYETHILNHHSSPLSTLAIVRRSFWVPKGRKIAEKSIHKTCLPCRRFSAMSFDLPSFPPLPAERVRQAPPFLYSGLDFCGPLHIKTHSIQLLPRKNSKPVTTKYWIVLWVCLVTRAISLDLVPDLSATNFLLAFRRFSAKFGLPSTIYSDNAPTFIACQKLIQQFGTSWTFRVPYAAWQGGHYERMVALIKFHLRRTLSTGVIPKTATVELVSTILAEVESIVNSRPISFDSANPAEVRPIRPIDFLRPSDQRTTTPFSPLSLPQNFPPNPPSSTQSRLSILWNQISQSLSIHLANWRSHYLLSLRERYKKLTQSHQWPIKGELVIVKSDSPRSLWPVAIILEIFFSRSNLPSSAKIKFTNGHTSIRSVSHLFPLETTEEKEQRSLPSPPTKHQENALAIPPSDSHGIATSVPDANPDHSPERFLELRNRKIPRK